MTVKLTWYGHGTWWIEADGHKILLDPFLNESPTAPVKAEDCDPDFILVSHGHFDHVADVEAIAKRTGALVIGIYEVAQWFAGKGIENTLGMNIGGKTSQPFGEVRMTMARHSSSMPDGSYGGEPAGFHLTIGDKRIYFACDTALFSDMSLIGDLGVDLAVLPIGDLFTMGPEDSVKAAKLVGATQVLPAHYGTWPPIEQNAQQWAQQIESSTDAKAVVLQPGESYEI